MITPIILTNALNDAFVFTKTDVKIEKNETSFNHNMHIASMYLKKYIITNHRDNSQTCSSSCFEIKKNPQLCDRLDNSLFDHIGVDKSDDKYDVLIKIINHFKKKTYDIDMWFCTWGKGLNNLYFTREEVYDMDRKCTKKSVDDKSVMMFMIDKWRNKQIIKNYEKKTGKKFDIKTINSNIDLNKTVDKSKSWVSVVKDT